MSDVLFPQVKVPLSSMDGNVFSLIGIASGLARKAKVPKEDIDRFQSEALSSESYDEVIRLTMRYFTTK